MTHQPPIITVEALASLIRVDHELLRAAIDRGDLPGLKRVRGDRVRLTRRGARSLAEALLAGRRRDD